MKKNLFRRARTRLTYANVVATLSLFIALGGVSYAATSLAKDSVDTQSIKRAAVTSPKIKNKTITGADVKSNTLTGNQINEASLAVPSAAFADAAGTAVNTFNVSKSVRSSVTGTDEDSARDAATPIPLADHGSVSIYAKCFRETNTNETHFEVYAATGGENALLNGYSISDYQYSDSGLLDNFTKEIYRQVTDDETDGADTFDDDYGDNASVVGPDGKALFFTVFDYARNGNPTRSPGVLPNEDSCYFQVSGSKQG